jgi:hypothetical protein
VLPDGIFSKQNATLDKFWERLAMKDVGKFYEHFVHFTYCRLVYFMAIWFTLWSFWYVICTKKNLATLESKI